MALKRLGQMDRLGKLPRHEAEYRTRRASREGLRAWANEKTFHRRREGPCVLFREPQGSKGPVFWPGLRIGARILAGIFKGSCDYIDEARAVGAGMARHERLRHGNLLALGSQRARAGASRFCAIDVEAGVGPYGDFPQIVDSPSLRERLCPPDLDWFKRARREVVREAVDNARRIRPLAGRDRFVV